MLTGHRREALDLEKDIKLAKAEKKLTYQKVCCSRMLSTRYA